MTISYRNIVRRLILIVLGIIVGISVYNINAMAVGKNSLPMPFGVGFASVQSGSMEPTLSVGDLLMVKPAETYEAGDIVVYQSENILIVHRIISIAGDVVVTQGDANNSPDSAFNAANIKGKVELSIPLVGYLADFIKTPIGVLLIVITCVALVELSFRHDVSQAKHDPRTIAINNLEREIEALRAQNNE